MSLLVDLLSTVSVVGVWPRFVEPKMLKTTHLDWSLPDHNHLQGLRILQISDLHFHAKLSSRFLKKIIKKVRREKPDLILFTGDFLCYSQLEDEERLHDFLNQFSAPLGCYCILGNHDYANYVSRNDAGIYDMLAPLTPTRGLFRGLSLLFKPTRITNQVSAAAKAIPSHPGLVSLLQQTPFKLLENETKILPIGLNLTGLGELALGKCEPDTAFTHYDLTLPGIVLAHNPDAIPTLLNYPGDWILAGHSHGEQIHFPYFKPLKKLSQKLTRLTHPQYARGLIQEQGKKLYTNRGLGCHKPFRFCSPPEITVITT